MAYVAWSVVFGEQPSAAKWNILGTNDAYFDAQVGSGTAWATWSPSYVNITVGNGTVVSKYREIGKWVQLYYDLTFGNTTSISTNNTISLPVTASSDYVVAEGNLIGACTAHDASGQVYTGATRIQTTTTMVPVVYRADSTYTFESGLTSAIPMTWTTNDKLNFTMSYEAA